MAPTEPVPDPIGPHPSYIEVAKPYILQFSIDACLTSLSISASREDAVRLQGVSWIDAVRRHLSLPVRTFNIACIYYHKFRLLHSPDAAPGSSSGGYNWEHASAAALFTACKIEDTLKKSREILCASWNLKAVGSGGEQISPDDVRLEGPSKVIMGLERLMLESAGFDFRGREPNKLIVKLGRGVGFRRDAEGSTAWNLGIDLYRTWAPLKQGTATMAIACVELAARLHELAVTDDLVDKGVMSYGKWNTSRAEVMETLLDLLDLYTHHRTSTSIGPLYPLETFINIRITLNQEASAANIPRYATYASEASPKATNGLARSTKNGIDKLEPTSPLTPATPGTISPGTMAPASAIGIRGQNGTVRFMLDAERARNEAVAYERYHKIEEEEYEEEVEIDPPKEPDRRREPDRNDERRDERRDDRREPEARRVR